MVGRMSLEGSTERSDSNRGRSLRIILSNPPTNLAGSQYLTRTRYWLPARFVDIGELSYFDAPCR